MDDDRTNRHLAAILAADVVGYSRMMAADEAGTLAALRAHRETLFDPAVQRHHGRVVKLMGDGTLVEFFSVVDAVECALDIQLRAAEGAVSKLTITLRIGINLGDVIVDGDDIYGDGVNVAARLEPLAEPGGVCVASIVNESVGSRINVKFSDSGEVQVKNIDRPIHIWKWRPDAGGTKASALSAIAPPVMASEEYAQASIAVLPFDNMSGDPEQEYFSDGITEDLITDLSQVAGLMVIARTSSFAYKGKRTDIRAVGRELGVTSVLEGSIRRAGNRVRINAQLIDAETGGHVWAKRYDRELTDIFEVQDEVTREIVEALKVTLSPGDETQLEGGGTKSVEAHDLFLKGRELVRGQSKNAALFEQMHELFNQAIELDPHYSEPYAGLANAYMYDYQNRWSDDPESSLRKSDELSKKSLALNPADPYAQSIAAVVTAVLGNVEQARAMIDATLKRNPNNAEALNGRGSYEIFGGDPAKAVPYFEKAMRLDPAQKHSYLHWLGLAHLLQRHYETAIVLFKQRIVEVPDSDISRSLLASALGGQGDTDDAKKVWAKLMKINPKYSFAEHMSRLPYADPTKFEPIAEGLRNAGLIE
ncbi:MAG: adenylate/guanylate cyclase domain-containing protein [Alphaproteobacteria bacterium]